MHGHPLQQHPSHMTAPYNNSLPEYPPPPMQSHSQSQAWMARDEQGGVIGGGWPPQEPNPWWDNSLCYSQSNSRLENFVSYGSVATNAGGSNGGSGMIGPNASTTAVTSATTMNDTRWTSRSVSRAVAADDTFRKKSRRDLRVDVESFASMVHDAALDSPSHHDTSSLPKPFVTPKQSQANNTDSSSREHNLPNRVTSADTGDYTPFSNASDETDVSGDVFDSVRNASFFTECSMFDLPDCLTKTNAMEDDVLQQPRQQCDLLPVGSFIRHYFYNPDSPEFTSLQQFDWAVVLGIAMGFFTAYWKVFIDYGVDLVWVTLPNQLLEWGVFTEPNGWFPLHHYMWITPAIFGGILSCLFVLLQCPDQNQWIHSVHARGIQQHDAFGVLFLLSTAGMWSGMSLGPELPLVLLGGMVGSRLAMATQQSVLQARILNLTAASAAVSGFFGFPMAGALFVLEL
jgi:Voltage gated chloride channel